MRKIIHWALVMVIGMLALAPLATAQSPSKIGALMATQGVAMENGFIQVIVGGEGAVVMGTTGGDPSIQGDENKPLLFGYPRAVITGYPSLRIVKSGLVSDFNLTNQPRSFGPAVANGAIVTRWLIEGVEVTERIAFFSNPFSNREDMASIAYTVRNAGDDALSAGIRCMLDVQVGGNDSAPFFLPGIGNVDTEQDFGAANLPEYFKAFESPSYAEDSLKAMGLLRGFGVTAPDRFVLATWARGSRGGQGLGIMNTLWDYTVTPGAKIGDSTATWWWNPVALNKGQQAAFQTAYGLGIGGGTAWFDAPARVDCASKRVTANLWVSNTTGSTFRNGRATLTLPAGLRLAAGQNATLVIGELAAQQARSVSWVIEADARRDEDLTFQASATFDNLNQPFVVRWTIHVPDCPVTPTPRVTLVPTPTPAPEVPEPGSLLLLGAGLAALAGLIKIRRR